MHTNVPPRAAMQRLTSTRCHIFLCSSPCMTAWLPHSLSPHQSQCRHQLLAAINVPLRPLHIVTVYVYCAFLAKIQKKT